MSLFQSIKRSGGILSRIKQGASKIVGRLATTLNPKVKRDIPESDRIYSKVSSASYQAERNRPETIDGYIYDDLLSSQKVAVYHNPVGKQVIIGYRGTVPTDAEDLYNDLQIIQKDFKKRDDLLQSSRFKDSISIVDKVKRKYPPYTITLTGHSLGGRLAVEVGLNKNVPSINFNPGGGNFKKNQSRNDGKTKIYVAKGDPISIGFAKDRNATVINKNPSKYNINHTLDYYL